MQIFVFLMTYIMKLDFMKGYRTYTAAAAAIGYGVYLCFGCNPDYEKAFAAFVSALALMGIRGKDEIPPNTTNPVVAK